MDLHNVSIRSVYFSVFQLHQARVFRPSDKIDVFNNFLYLSLASFKIFYSNSIIYYLERSCNIQRQMTNFLILENKFPTSIFGLDHVAFIFAPSK